MTNFGKANQLRMHPNYERLTDMASNSHARGRTPSGVNELDISLARLYSYAFRGQVIGAFHATRHALEEIRPGDSLSAAHLSRADELLADLANRSMDTVSQDVRALISTFHHYSTHVARTVDALGRACNLERSPELNRIRDRFVCQMERITHGNGLHLTRDTSAPEQGCFVVPNLGITIVPLVYGDHHSWNLAWLDVAHPEVPYHLHKEGVEIHLGFPPMHGFTVLGGAKAELSEGYAMPIPPNIRHGYTNIGQQAHHVPFIFGSLTCGGWGVFLDVEPQPCELDQLETVPVLSNRFNGTVLLEREIARVSERYSSIRYPIIPAEKTDRDGVGGLELSIAHVTARGIELSIDRFCIVSVVRGHGILSMADQQIEIASHDHFGIPANLTANITNVGTEPLVLLDAVLRPASNWLR